MVRITLLALILIAQPALAAQLTWDLRRDFLPKNRKQNPNRDRYGNAAWHFLRTSKSIGQIGTRSWVRDGVYVRLGQPSQSMFDAPLDGWIFQTKPKHLAPFVSQVTKAHNIGVQFNGGEIVVAPGPDHAVVVGWRSPVSGVFRAKGRFIHAQSCCGVNSQINWYVEKGGAPRSSPHPMKSLAKGTSDFGTGNKKSSFDIKGQRIRKGEFLYFIVDSKADGTGTPHHGDATQLELVISVDGSPDAFKPPTFEKDVRPILAAHCFNCHGADAQESGLDLRKVSSMIRGGDSGPAIVPGKPGRSYLIDLLGRQEMPPKDHKPLTNDQIGLITFWVELGAKGKEDVSSVKPRPMVSDKDRQYWAFQTPKKIPLPKLSPTGLARSRTAVDRLLLHRLEAKGLSFSPEADKATLIRRATIDLIGLPPSPAEVQAFVSDRRPGAYERMIDRLLASPHYGERWGRHWLDAAGYVDNRLFDGDFATIYKNEGIWRYRDYVIKAHNTDMPWDRFIQEQLAGDEMVDWRNKWSDEIREKLVATGYLRMIEDHTSEAQYGIKKRYEVLFDLMNMVSTSMMGMTLNCCRCHNHKFDPLPHRDYYRFMANFESAYNTRNWLKPQNRWVPDVGPLERRRIDTSNGRIAREVAAKNKSLKAATKAKEQSKVAKLKQEIAALNGQRRDYGKMQVLFDVDKGSDTRVLRRGDADREGIAVTAGYPEILSAPGRTSPKKLVSRSSSTGRRWALGRWLTERRHPLTARVIVNRVWSHHFGRPIVPTPDNFGRSGMPPTHPKLLDWLAVEFMEEGWSLKHLHRLIMTSTAYRQQSQRPGESSKQAKMDPTNTLLWRMNFRRLDAEIIRDSVLAVSGQLDRRSGGPPVDMDLQPSNGLSMVNKSRRQHGRRSVYVFARRVYPLRFLEVFDSPVMPVNCTHRPTSATVLQSFTFLNGPFVLEAADSVANKVAATTSDKRKQVELAYRQVLLRAPRKYELTRCVQFLQLQGKAYKATKKKDRSLVDLCHMLLCTNEFLYVD